MNKIVLMGRLTRDPEVRYSATERQMAIARYTLAVDRRNAKRNGEQTADFIPCVAFDRDGEWAEKYLRQGMKIIVTGHIQTGSYTNRDGQRVYTTDVIIEEQEFAESKNAGEMAAALGSVTEDPVISEPEKVKRGRKNTPAAEDEYMPIPEGEGLPFDE